LKALQNNQYKEKEERNKNKKTKIRGLRMGNIQSRFIIKGKKYIKKLFLYQNALFFFKVSFGDMTILQRY
jgi:hypothetical protein